MLSLLAKTCVWLLGVVEMLTLCMIFLMHAPMYIAKDTQINIRFLANFNDAMM
jgi:hypothetical protein